MVPGKLDLICPQGATFSKVFQLFDNNDVPMDLSGYTADMQARDSYSSKRQLFQIDTNSGIVISGNEITITIPYSVTETFIPGKYVWDIEITSAGMTRSRLLEGTLTVTAGITR